VIPITQPSKIYGIWQAGQVAKIVPDVVVIGCGVQASAGVPNFGEARDAAIDSRAALGGRAVTDAYAVVTRDGAVAVFQGLGRASREGTGRCGRLTKGRWQVRQSNMAGRWPRPSSAGVGSQCWGMCHWRVRSCAVLLLQLFA
jgi:hypothetical protein